MDLDMLARERKKLRLALLRFVYESTGGHLLSAVPQPIVRKAAHDLGAVSYEAEAAITYLVDQCQLQWKGHNLSMTAMGIDFVEEEKLDEQPELAIPIVNITNINAPTGSVQIGGSGNRATVQPRVNIPSEIVESLGELKTAVTAIEDAHQAEEAEELLDGLRLYAEIDAPGKALVKVTGEALSRHLPKYQAAIRMIVGWVVSRIVGS